MMSYVDGQDFDIIALASKFAREEIAPWAAAGNFDIFPMPLWEKAGAAGLLGIAVPRKYGGLGGSYLTITAAAEALVGLGRNPGFGLSWLIHNVVARLVFWELGRDDQRSRYLPALAAGSITASISISEPRVGAHPKYLQTRARRRSEEYVIDGEKSYLTNGPFVNLYVVLAITGGAEERKEFSALIVPRETPGVTMTPPMSLEAFRPSPHCGIRLTACAVGVDNMVGAAGTAYPDLAIAFREREDVALMGLVLGGMGRQMEILLPAVRSSKQGPNKELTAALGRLRYLRDALRLVVYTAARRLDAVGGDDLLSLVLSSRDLARQFQDELRQLAATFSIADQEEYGMLTADLGRTINLAGQVMMLKQQKHGAALLRDL